MKTLARIMLFTLAMTCTAQAGQMLIPGPGGLRYSRPYPNPGQYYGGPRYAPAQHYGPPPVYYGRRGPDIGSALAGAAIGAFLGAVMPPRFPPPPVFTALPPQPLPMPQPEPVVEPMPPDAMADVAEVNPQGITRQEVEQALAGWCQEPRNARAPMCQKMGARQQ
jgi:hypothetical protein